MKTQTHNVKKVTYKHAWSSYTVDKIELHNITANRIRITMTKM